MDRSEIAMGAAAMAAQRAPAKCEPVGVLSAAELLELPKTDEWFEREECLIYFHLDVARRLRGRLDRMDETNGEYHEALIEREKALTAARGHYEALRFEGFRMSGDLAEMMLAEGA